MARKVRHSALESRSARLKLKVRRRPYPGPSLARGIALMYRRNKTNGTWVLKASDGHGAYWTKGFALADDFEDADGKNVLTFHQGQDAAKKLARGEDGSADNAPITVDSALKDYRRDLISRNANPYNAEHPRLHLTSVLLSKPVALLTTTELKKWRDDPAYVTMYALRHSSIVRMLLLNVPIRLVASLHNTSVAMIEKHYSRYIVEYSDEISRKALLQHEAPSGENVVALVS